MTKITLEALAEAGASITISAARLLELSQEPDNPTEPAEPIEPVVTLFDFGSGHDFIVADGQDPSTKGATWIDSFRKWGVRRLEKNGDGAIKRYVEGFTHVNFSSGLKLRAGFVDSELVGGMISTEDSMAFKRGSIETRARIVSIPDGYHIWQALFPANGDRYPEIDISETVHGRANPSNGKVHWNHHLEGGASGDRCHAPAQRWEGICFAPIDAGWHTYRLESTDQGLWWFFDGQLVRTSPVPLTKAMYYVAAWEASGSWPGAITDQKAVADFEIDFIRIEQAG